MYRLCLNVEKEGLFNNFIVIGSVQGSGLEQFLGWIIMPFNSSLVSIFL